MHRILHPHPDTPCEAISAIEVEVERPDPGRLHLRYLLTGSIRTVRLPAPGVPTRSDRLWQHSCLELFIRPGSASGYHEFNFAPSLEWAAYRLSGYRSGMLPAAEMAEPRLASRSSAKRYEMDVGLDLNPLADLPTAACWNLGLSAIVEEAGGRKSYWALAHPDGEPDFHHSACFALELPAATQA